MASRMLVMLAGLILGVTLFVGQLNRNGRSGPPRVGQTAP